MIRRALERDPKEGRLWRYWLYLCADELGRSPESMLETFPKSASRYGRHVRSTLEHLSSASAIRIDCGGRGFVDRQGQEWVSDRFFEGGTIQSNPYVSLTNSPSPRLFRRRRVFLTSEGVCSISNPAPARSLSGCSSYGRNSGEWRAISQSVSRPPGRQLGHTERRSARLLKRHHA